MQVLSFCLLIWARRPARGGQHGHQKYERALTPADPCVTVFVHKPPLCRGCGGKLTGVDPAPLRHQVWDVPKIEPLVTEHLRHRLTCECCGVTTCASFLPASRRVKLGLGWLRSLRY